MSKFKGFLQRKDIEISLKRYGIDALGAMAQGLFCTLLVGTILNTLGTQLHIGFLNAVIVTVGKGEAAVSYTMGGIASAMVGPAMAVAIGYALHAPAMVLFSLIMAFQVNSELSLIFLGTVPVLAVGMYLIISHAHPIFERVFRTYDRLNKVVQENLRGMDVKEGTEKA